MGQLPKYEMSASFVYLCASMSYKIELITCMKASSWRGQTFSSWSLWQKRFENFWWKGVLKAQQLGPISKLLRPAQVTPVNTRGIEKRRHLGPNVYNFFAATIFFGKLGCRICGTSELAPYKSTLLNNYGWRGSIYGTVCTKEHLLHQLLNWTFYAVCCNKKL